MAGRIIYLEVDDEITSAAARIRTAEADAARGRPAVRLARRDLADQLPAAVARCADPREAAVDRGRGSGDAGAGRVGRPAGLRLGRRVRVVAGRPRGRGVPGGRSGSGGRRGRDSAARTRAGRAGRRRHVGLVVPAAAAAAATAAARAGGAVHGRPGRARRDDPGAGLSGRRRRRERAPRSRPRPTAPRRGPVAAARTRRDPDAVADRRRHPRPGPAGRCRRDLPAAAVGDHRGHAHGRSRSDRSRSRSSPTRPRPRPTRPAPSSRPSS